MKYIIPVLCLLFWANASAQTQALRITPQYPQRGQRVTITYHTDAPGAKIPASADAVTLVFTYSNLYSVPLKINMQKEGNTWQTSFVLPSYSIFATFYLESGDTIDKPAPNRHYELAVYDSARRPVKNGYLYKAYSLGTQMGKSEQLPALQEKLYLQELQQYPDNYEARVRLLYYRSQHGGETARAAALKEAHEVIAQRFYAQPGSMANLNYVTMGYLILGEGSRLDSIRDVVLRNYPHTDAAHELFTRVAAREADTAKRIALLENALREETPRNSASFNGIHEMLFGLYLSRHDAAHALVHARKMAAQQNPYTPSTLKEIAEKLTAHRLAPDSALHYAQRALALADSFPVGIIRYFPEFGYLPPYVDDSTRGAAIARAKANLLSLTAIIYGRMQQEPVLTANTETPHKTAARQQQAETAIRQALSLSTDGETLRNAAQYYTAAQQSAQAYRLYRQMVLNAPSDTMAAGALRRSYVAWRGDTLGLQKQLDTLRLAWETKMKAALAQQRIGKPMPALTGIVDMDGKPVPASFFRNKVVVMDFWATWCVPCMQEMPYVHKVYEKYRNNPDVVFMIINSGARNTLADAQNWSGRKRYGFPVYYNGDAAIGDKLGFNIIPATFVADRQGQLQFKTIGFEGPGIEQKLDLQIALLLE